MRVVAPCECPKTYFTNPMPKQSNNRFMNSNICFTLAAVIHTALVILDVIRATL
jgi:hypothetical protein